MYLTVVKDGLLQRMTRMNILAREGLVALTPEEVARLDTIRAPSA